MTTPVAEETIFGYDLKDGTYTVNRQEASVVWMIFYMYIVCELSHERIALHLNRLGISPPEDKWTDLVVYGLLTNSVYISCGSSPDILQDIEAWEQAQS
jgi:hypothetical protein